jgi:hypothetical protein
MLGGADLVGGDRQVAHGQIAASVLQADNRADRPEPLLRRAEILIPVVEDGQDLKSLWLWRQRNRDVA